MTLGLDESDVGPRCVGTELALVERLRSRDSAAFAELLSTYHGPLMRLASGIVSSRATAEEVVQETWIGVLAGLARFEGRSRLKTWLFRILMNIANSRAVRERRTVPFSALGADEANAKEEPAVDPTRFHSNGMWATPPRPWSDAPALERLLNRESLAVLEAAMAQLPTGQRAVVTLRDVEGLDPDEICNVLGISETNQRVLLHRARARLRAALDAHLERR